MKRLGTAVLMGMLCAEPYVAVTQTSGLFAQEAQTAAQKLHDYLSKKGKSGKGNYLYFSYPGLEGRIYVGRAYHIMSESGYRFVCVENMVVGGGTADSLKKGGLKIEEAFEKGEGVEKYTKIGDGKLGTNPNDYYFCPQEAKVVADGQTKINVSLKSCANGPDTGKFDANFEALANHILESK
jgi:hypothetical protein